MMPLKGEYDKVNKDLKKWEVSVDQLERLFEILVEIVVSYTQIEEKVEDSYMTKQ